MTTFIPYNPALPFQFPATLDGTTCNVVVTFNIGSQRPYINVFNSSNTLIVAPALVASPDDYDINMVGGYFTTSTLVFRETSQQFEINP